MGKRTNPRRDRDGLRRHRRAAEAGDAEAMFHLGTLLSERFDEEGLVWLRRAVEAAPDDVAMRNNLGHALRQAGAVEESVAVFEALVSKEPRRAPFHYGLGTGWLKQGRLEDAARSFGRAVALEPAFVEALRQRGEVLEALGRPTEAMALWTQALVLTPKHAPSLRKVGLLHAFFGRKPVAVAMLRQCLALAPGDAMATHMLGALTGEGPVKADEVYVRDLFDAFADTFDQHLEGVLDYQVPARLGDLLSRSFRRVLDLGCGTGLMAAHLDAAYLEGVDLSAGMVAKAKERGGYDLLVVDGIDSHLEKARGFDLVVAADVFVYVGALGDVFAGVRHALDKGYFAFTTEIHDGQGVQLLPNGRYAHSVAEVDRLCAEHGFELVERRVERLRTEAGANVMGQLVLLHAPR